MTPEPLEQSGVGGGGVTVWAVLSGGPSADAKVELFWNQSDAAAHVALVGATTNDVAVVTPLRLRGERHRCRLCGEPVVLDDLADPMSCYHAGDADDLGDHTAELRDPP